MNAIQISAAITKRATAAVMRAKVAAQTKIHAVV